MTEAGKREITVMLQSWSSGDRSSADQLMPLVYDELRRVAANYARSERPDHTLQPTALVHEAYLRLIDISTVTWQDRAHFFAVASQVMRHILVDHARTKGRDKRGGAAQKLSLDEAISFAPAQDIGLLKLDEALDQLKEQDERQAKIVELKFFGGLTIEETGEVMGISRATVKREWTIAKAWLFRQLSTDR